MSAFNLLHLVTKSQPVALRACGLPSGSCRDKKDCKVVFSQEELRKRLTPLQYHVTQEKGTESAFEGEYTHHKAQGIYKCVVCGTPLFKSETKFDSNSESTRSSLNYFHQLRQHFCFISRREKICILSSKQQQKKHLKTIIGADKKSITWNSLKTVPSPPLHQQECHTGR
ncbi:methionine-R-sulfoxide reductase B3 isoform X2 [Empidonax traillii]|uniref:methionine-R-sulfoxide reductase B3 isoform X2 n=1 Tax=Empidonax traillii TaxID=164674 RepID=UPI000FFDAC01|nr:methionine-R-sulfoxide reductase B3 isoform X2 [Empidonax traillii]